MVTTLVELQVASLPEDRATFTMDSLGNDVSNHCELLQPYMSEIDTSTQPRDEPC